MDRKNGKRMAAALLAAFFCILFSVSALADGTSLAVTYGFRNNARSGMLLPVEVTVDVPEGSLSGGFAVVEIPGDTGTLSYTAPVEILSGTGTVRFVVTIPYGYAGTERTGDRLFVHFLNEDGEELAAKEVAVSYRGSGKDAFLGLVATDPGSLSWLDHLNLTDEINTRTAVLGVGDLPESAAGLSQLDGIVISGISVSAIPEASREAILAWVRDGGTLLLGTGATGDPFGSFADATGFSADGLPEVKDVDLGMQYSVSGPDGAVRSLLVRKVSCPGAEVLYETEDLPVLTVLNFGSGRILTAAYDLCDLSAFGAEHPEYAVDLLKAAFGTGGLRALSRSALTGRERQEVMEQLTSVFEGGLSGNMLVYVVIAVWYVAIAGGVLYLLLKRKGLSACYSLGVILCAVIGGFVIWFVSGKTRIERPQIRYAACIEQKEGEDSAETTLFLDLSRPDTAPVTFSAPREMTILPEKASGTVSITTGKTKMLAITGQKQFEDNIFTVSGRVEGQPAEVQLLQETGDTGETAFVRNFSGETLHEAFALCYDRLYLFGDIGPGETAWADDVRYCPTAMSQVIADRVLSGSDLPCAAQKSALLQYVLAKRCGAYFDTAILFAFTDEVPELLSDSGYDPEGSLVTVFDTGERSGTGSGFRRSVLATAPAVISGSYDTATNTIQSGGQTVIEYYLGAEGRVSGLGMHALAEDMAGGDLAAFEGQMAIYNYRNSSYDPVSTAKTEYTEEELSAWLSPSNSLLVRYTPGGDPDSTVKMFLPVPEVTAKTAPSAEESGGPD